MKDLDKMRKTPTMLTSLRICHLKMFLTKSWRSCRKIANEKNADQNDLNFSVNDKRRMDYSRSSNFKYLMLTNLGSLYIFLSALAAICAVLVGIYEVLILCHFLCIYPFTMKNRSYMLFSQNFLF